MPDTPENRLKLAVFVAQEIVMDAKIPHATRDAVGLIIEEARKRAKNVDNRDKSLTLRLRELGGLVRAAGDVAVVEGTTLIEARHIKEAMRTARPVEEQLHGGRLIRHELLREGLVSVSVLELPCP
jgi:ATP-dependent Lon protease